jgi:MoaA/NifB/PqqE/SkfB family radical SAM enzyme
MEMTMDGRKQAISAIPLLESSGLDFLWLQITDFCNLQCVHCYAGSGPLNSLTGSMGFEDWCDVMTEARAVGCAQLQFIGGEPTLHPYLVDLIEKGVGLGFESVEVYTNGTRFTDSQRTAFCKNRVGLAFSIYGATEAIHEQVTRNTGSFARTVRNIKWAIDAGLDVRCGIIKVAESEGHIDETIAFLHSLGVVRVKVDGIRGIGRGADRQSKLSANKDQIGELCGNCWRGTLCVLPDRRITPCPVANFFPVGVWDGSFRSALAGKSLADFRRSQRVRELQAQTCRPADCSPCMPNSNCSPRSCVPSWRVDPNQQTLRAEERTAEITEI